MPIGFDAGDFGGGRTRWRTPAAATDVWDGLNPWRDDPEPEPATGFWAWVEVDASTVEPVIWTRWVTTADGRVCPECGPLDGAVWEEGFGPLPPLHVNCRCARVPAFTLWRVRETAGWELRWTE